MCPHEQRGNPCSLNVGLRLLGDRSHCVCHHGVEYCLRLCRMSVAAYYVSVAVEYYGERKLVYGVGVGGGVVAQMYVGPRHSQ